MNNNFGHTLSARCCSPVASLVGTLAMLVVTLSAHILYADTNLVWSDEFSGASLDTNKWTFDIGNGFLAGGYWVPGWGNNELEYYTSRTNNVYVTNGFLHIRALQETYAGYNYTSARIKTKGRFSKKYGRLEFRAKLPSGTGFWPAFWLLPRDSPYGNWPNSGEIDVMENNGDVPNEVGGTIHYGGANGHDVYSGHTYTFPEGASVTNFHTYDLDWTTNSIRWSVDGHLYETQTNWWSNVGTSANTYPYPAPFDQPFYIIVNLAIGGNYLGNPTTNAINASLPGELVVDYVRVYDETPPLALSIAPQAGQTIAIQWPTDIVCHLQQLEAPLGLARGGAWTNVDGAANPFLVSVGAIEGPVFYRLVSP